jgi:hypothetical protein
MAREIREMCRDRSSMEPIHHQEQELTDHADPDHLKEEL